MERKLSNNPRNHRLGFDAIVGNPPFVNAIEGRVNPMVKPLLKRRFPSLAGTADLGFYFIALSRSLLNNGGRIGLIQPRVFLNARAAEPLREELMQSLPPQYLFVPNRSDFFPGASVFVCVVVLGRGLDCMVSTDDNIADAKWDRIQVDGANWWDVITRSLHGCEPQTQAGLRVKDLFFVSASMTTGEAYDVVPHLVDEEQSDCLKLVTTGLIDPDKCLWGTERCRYLKRDFQFPRVRPGADLPKSLQKRLSKACRPKIIVAGLSKRVECFFDRNGEYVGAVSTYSIFHSTDDVTRLRRLADHLLSDWATDRFRQVLGANAMGGGNTTMKKDFLETLSLPAEWGS